MALLDLQAMETPATELGNNSSHSNHSCSASDLSALLCGDHSVLSVTLCHN
ncbi:SapB/AmfS family lanthipeptide [Phytohabitans sp. ZYX-F-186]|uniref:SapB/AmfS family lanthipeptide n=1 Tax=Phytohabitans maris TaxID=3071409 RepID=A0ABU0ZHA0_9ACTN|nr:SapB/AmfS family lanthipeptide [Phytohabitans sp. ZYX-F-186]MDQ7906431.1 SapB/AmfS family lanthipeptide [Phytohabitans sp. ZYX-F-186]